MAIFMTNSDNFDNYQISSKLAQRWLSIISMVETERKRDRDLETSSSKIVTSPRSLLEGKSIIVGCGEYKCPPIRKWQCGFLAHPLNLRNGWGD